MNRTAQWMCCLLAVAAAPAGADLGTALTPSTRPAAGTAGTLSILQYRRDLSFTAERRKAAVEGLLAAGAEGKKVLAEEAGALAASWRKRTLPSVRYAASAAAALVRARERWQDAVKDALGRVNGTAKGDGDGVRTMLKYTDRAERRYRKYLEKIKAALPRIRNLRAATARINQYARARARAEAGTTALVHTTASLAREAKVKYNPRAEQILDDERRTQRIADWVAGHNRKARGKIDREEIENVRLLNAYRIRMGRVPLALSGPLYKAAMQHSKEMRDRDYFAHASPVARYATPAKRAAWAEYAPSRSVGENIAMGISSGSRAHKGWIESPPHHVNMLNSRYREIGIAKAGRYWTQLFGSRGKDPWEGKK